MLVGGSRSRETSFYVAMMSTWGYEEGLFILVVGGRTSIAHATLHRYPFKENVRKKQFTQISLMPLTRQCAGHGARANPPGLPSLYLITVLGGLVGLQHGTAGPGAWLRDCRVLLYGAPDCFREVLAAGRLVQGGGTPGRGGGTNPQRPKHIFDRTIAPGGNTDFCPLQSPSKLGQQFLQFLILGQSFSVCVGKLEMGGRKQMDLSLMGPKKP